MAVGAQRVAGVRRPILPDCVGWASVPSTSSGQAFCLPTLGEDAGFVPRGQTVKLGEFKSEVQHSGINERGLNAVGLTPCGLLSGRATVENVATDEKHYAEFDQNHRC